MAKSVLVVEDDPDISANMKAFLEGEGFSVHTSKDGAAALEYLASSPAMPGAIVLDLMMPIMNGWEFRKRQLENETIRSIPVIVVTASGAGLGEMAVDEVVHKPVDLDLFLRAIERAFLRS